MFTGIINETGTILNKKDTPDGAVFTISAKEALKDKKIGQSIAIDGVCCTITELTNEQFQIFASIETLKVSTFNQFKKGQKVNLEPAMKLNDSLDGHLVQGHVDAQGKVSEIKTDSEKELSFSIKFPQTIKQYLAPKGSVTINGVSLTIAELTNEEFTIKIIPLTFALTNLVNLKVGDAVNIETDMIARYLASILNQQHAGK